ncbi:MAG: DUF2202 domain-containing protein [Acidobacteria bacterium]|nr:DUF2202 domain-containing protein [Acidobacteriota bacterium]
MLRLAGWMLMAAVLAGCDADSSPTSPTAIPPPTGTLTILLERAIQDEYRAENIYQGVLGDFGSVQPFANVLGAEERHSTAIGRLFTARGLAVPPAMSTVATVPHFGSVAAACAAGVVAERENIAMYDDLLRSDLPVDVRQVFTNNRSASLLNHLPAFERCA